MPSISKEDQPITEKQPLERVEGTGRKICKLQVIEGHLQMTLAERGDGGYPNSDRVRGVA